VLGDAGLELRACRAGVSAGGLGVGLGLLGLAGHLLSHLPGFRLAGLGVEPGRLLLRGGPPGLRSAAIIRLLLHNARGPMSLRRRRGRPRARCRPPCAAGMASPPGRLTW
jgi:hypothetical protein